MAAPVSRPTPPEHGEPWLGESPCPSAVYRRSSRRPARPRHRGSPLRQRPPAWRASPGRHRSLPVLCGRLSDADVSRGRPHGPALFSSTRHQPAAGPGRTGGPAGWGPAFEERNRCPSSHVRCRVRPGAPCLGAQGLRPAIPARPPRGLPAFRRDICQLCGLRPAEEAHHWPWRYPSDEKIAADHLTALCRPLPSGWLRCAGCSPGRKRGCGSSWRLRSRAWAASASPGISRAIAAARSGRLASHPATPRVGAGSARADRARCPPGAGRGLPWACERYVRLDAILSLRRCGRSTSVTELAPPSVLPSLPEPHPVGAAGRLARGRNRRLFGAARRAGRDTTLTARGARAGGFLSRRRESSPEAVSQQGRAMSRSGGTRCSRNRRATGAPRRDGHAGPDRRAGLRTKPITSEAGSGRRVKTTDDY